MNTKHVQEGVSLLELIVVVVIIGIAASGLAVLINNTLRHSADPLILQQANAVARSYLEEVTLRPICDPDFDPDADPATLTVCPVDCVVSACTTCGGLGVAPVGTRAQFDDICDYDGLADNGVTDQAGNAVPGLEEFNVSVTVDDAAVLSGLNGANGQIVLINVSVTHDTNTAVNAQLSAYRANY